MTEEQTDQLIELLKLAKKHLVTTKAPLALRERIRDMRLVTKHIKSTIK